MVWEVASLTHKFLSFFIIFNAATGRISHPLTQFTIIRRSGQGDAFLGLERWNLKCDTLQLPNKCKNLDIKLAVNATLLSR